MLKEASSTKPAASRIVGHYGREMDVPLHSMLGLAALTQVMAEHGVVADRLFEGTGIAADSISSPEARLSHRQKIALLTNVLRLSPEPAIGLLAGQRQRVSDFGVFGYALLSSATFGEAIAFGVKHVRLAGPVLEKSFRVEGDVAIFEGHDVIDLGPVLPLATEFWFSSVQALASRVLERPFEATLLKLPYPAPAAAARYRDPALPGQFDAPFMDGISTQAARLRCPTNPIRPRSRPRLRPQPGDRGGTSRPIIKHACSNVGGLPRVEQYCLAPDMSLARASSLVEAVRATDIVGGVRKRLAIGFSSARMSLANSPSAAASSLELSQGVQE